MSAPERETFKILRQATTFRKSSEIAKRQTNSFRPGTSSQRVEHDFTFQIG
jgi:hypothetical protein